ncbi:MAG: TIGR03936 family radical SAM-associated protein [Treponema sp.]|jgi:radical SAM superfamily enzyme YgiQ (UPF0313 family)|nr:TIGR03936 family radical SAM-associated protein [Treponema sp.]
MRYIDPLVFGRKLLEIEKPSRYLGGEYGRLAKPSATLQAVIAFPDLYEIGMSNQALRILYNALNALPDVSCDRAFAPAPDFEALLRAEETPLYGLDSGIALGDADILMFTLGYELGGTELLTMLDLSHVPLHNEDRAQTDPIVIIGGPCTSNPLPYAQFADAFWLGEAEDGFFALAEKLRDMKQEGGRRDDLLEYLVSHPSVWSWKRRNEKKTRAIDADFATRPPSAAVFPIPNMKVIQHHGAVEIMRGCPNGCRFCHAGFWYRPMRQKTPNVIMQEAADFIKKGGYREISLSSLSTGDYQDIETLVDRLNAEYAPAHVSFQLPSLKVSTFSLPLLDKISAVRKSGLTFAVETPDAARQIALNKDVTLDAVVDVVLEARKHGWRGAKLYFMVGLSDDGDEAEKIVTFVKEAARRTRIHFNVNVGVFIPKPHTPFQWQRQLDEETARKRLDHIRASLKPLGHRVGVQNPFVSALEGVLSRGDERVGALIETAFKRGCRLDAWNEHIKTDVWRDILAENKALCDEILAEKDENTPLPWGGIDGGVGVSFLKKEWAKAAASEKTPPCEESCPHPCGVCGRESRIVKNVAVDHAEAEKGRLGQDVSQTSEATSLNKPSMKANSPTYRVVFTFSKQRQAVFYSHLDVVEIFSMALTRAGIPVKFSEGFNPLPRLEIAAPLSLGVAAEGELASIDTETFVDASAFLSAFNNQLPQGLCAVHAENVTIPFGAKKRSLASMVQGFTYKNGDTTDFVAPADEKSYRKSRGDSLFGLVRTGTRIACLTTS